MEDEVVRTPLDKRRPDSALPVDRRRRQGRIFENRPINDTPPRRSCVWSATEAKTFEPVPVWGAYPKGFVDWAIPVLGVPRSSVLHVCSGTLGRDVGGVRVDIRQDARPDVRADARRLPFRDSVFGAVLIDPPYSVEYSEELYGVAYPRPSHLLREASRVVRPGGRVGFLHFLVPHSTGTELVYERTFGVTKGCGYRIVAFTVFRRRDPELFA